MKKVFSREKFLEVKQRDNPKHHECDVALNWPHKCDGKTEAQCSPFVMHDDWMIEVEDTEDDR